MQVSFGEEDGDVRLPLASNNNSESEALANDDQTEQFRRKNKFKQVKLALLQLLPCQVVLLILLLFSRYELSADASLMETSVPVQLGGGAGRAEPEHLLRNFTFQVVLVLTFLGFCILTPTRFGSGQSGKPGYSQAARLILLVLTSLAIQMSLINRGFFYFTLSLTSEGQSQGSDLSSSSPSREWLFRLGVHDLTESLLCAVSLCLALLPSLLGRVAPAALLPIATVHVAAFTACRLLAEEVVLASDPGAVLPVHLFGPVFGLACAAAYSFRSSSSTSLATGGDRVSAGDSGWLSCSALMLASLPLVNGMTSESDADMTRCVVNTLMAATSAAVVSCAMALAWTHVTDRPFPVAPVLHGALVSGGVSVGAVATLMLQPFGAAVIGVVTGAASTAAFLVAAPRILPEFCNADDFGTLSFHAVPALLGGLSSVVMSLLSDYDGAPVSYFHGLYQIYPARIPLTERCTGQEAAPCRAEILSNSPFLEGRARGRTAQQQALCQAIAVAFTVLLSLVSGAASGALARVSAARCGNRHPPPAHLDEQFVLNFGPTAAAAMSAPSQQGRRRRNRSLRGNSRKPSE